MSLTTFCVEVVKKKLIYHYLLRNGSFMAIINKRHRDKPCLLRQKPIFS